LIRKISCLNKNVHCVAQIPGNSNFFQKSVFFSKIQNFHETRVGAFDSSSKITPGGLVDFICGAEMRRKPEKMAFFEKNIPPGGIAQK
jgi:hypothetical protein